MIITRITQVKVKGAEYAEPQIHHLHQKAVRRRSWDRSRIPPQTWGWVEEKIRQDWSPEQITLWMKKYKKISVSHEWIYQYIHADKRAGGDLHKHLRCQ